MKALRPRSPLLGPVPLTSAPSPARWSRWSRRHSDRLGLSRGFRRERPPRVTRYAGHSLKDLIRPQEQRRGHGDPEGLGRFEIDDERQPRRTLHRQVASIGALEDLVQHASCLPRDVSVTSPIRQ